MSMAAPIDAALAHKNSPSDIRQQGTIFLKKWCPDPESNQRHGDFQSPALPTELSGHTCDILLYNGGPSGT